MTKTLQAQDEQVLAKHKDSMMLSLTHRLDVARAANNLQLIQLLERERQAIAPETQPNPLTSLLVTLKDVTQAFVQSLRAGSKLQVQQIEAGGDRWWYAYNPQTGASVYADSDTELLLWIKSNYQGDH